jgi:hypothetical protein
MTQSQKGINGIINSIKNIIQIPIQKLKNFIDIFENRVFGPLYREYLYKKWPIVSSVGKDQDDNILNTGFPDYSSVYYIASFEKKNQVVLDGKVPDDITFLSIILYNNKGEAIYSIDDKNLYKDTEKTYRVEIKDNKISYNKKSENIEKILSETYCIIYRVYRTKKTPTIYPDYVPTINIKGIEVTDVDNNSRMKNSNKLQDLVYKLSESKFKRIHKINTVDIDESLENYFKKININEFFLPAKSQLSLVFPNHYSDYLIAFPKKSRVMKITGKLPEDIGMNQKNRYIGFMACNFITTATDDCISHEDLKNEYSIYISFTEEDAVQNGYKDTEDKLLLWKKENNCPVVVFRVLFESKDVMFPTINNTKTIYAGKELKKLNNQYYPNVECFQ